MNETLVQASWIAPMDAPIVRDRAIVFDDVEGRIIDVGRAVDLRRSHPDAQVREYPNAVILPGLVNPHTHLQLSNCPAAPAGTSFSDWILSLNPRLGPNHDFAGATKVGIEQCLRFGVTTVGDISPQMEVTRPVLAKSPVRAVSYGEVLGLGKRRFRFDELFAGAIDRTFESEKLRIGLTPHAPFTVDLPGYRECLATARSMNLPLATHLAETPEEEGFLRRKAGPLRDVWGNSFEDSVETFAGTPIEMARAVGLLDYPTLLAHVNYCTDDELDVLSRGKASVVYCPRTHAYFGHPPHRWREMLARGINVAVGTDSCASSPDLNLVDDLRLLHRIASDFPVDELWKMATIGAARAIQWESEVGSLTRGKAADFVVFPSQSDNPLRELLGSEIRPVEVWIAGQRIHA